MQAYGFPLPLLFSSLTAKTLRDSGAFSIFPTTIFFQGLNDKGSEHWCNWGSSGSISTRSKPVSTSTRKELESCLEMILSVTCPILNK